MSADNLEADNYCCASCGIAEVDDTKLKECDCCDLVRYCSDECQEDHRSEHETKCKERATKLRDEILFRQPESTHRGDCPICFLPLPLDVTKSSLYSCCCKVICNGCAYANVLRELQKNNQHPLCPFCRHPSAKNDEEIKKNWMRRIAANDTAAMGKMGYSHLEEEGDYDAAVKYWTKAADLGDAMAHYSLSIMYSEGRGVEKDDKKTIYHLEEAAIRGHAEAHYNLAMKEGEKGRSDRAVKHCIIAANLGYDESIQTLKECYKDGDISKDDFAAALRTHHAAVEATKSPHREEAAEFFAKHAHQLE